MNSCSICPVFCALVIFMAISEASTKVKHSTVVNWDPCISEETKVGEKQVGEIKQIRVYGNCTERCQLKINSSIEIEVDFIPGEDTDSLAPEMSGILGPIEIPFPGLRTSICDSVFTSTGETCPLKKNVLYTYRRSIPISEEYPPLTVDIKWRFITDKKRTSICFIIKSVITE